MQAQSSWFILQSGSDLSQGLEIALLIISLPLSLRGDVCWAVHTKGHAACNWECRTQCKVQANHSSNAFHRQCCHEGDQQIGRLTKVSGSQVTQSCALPNILVWSSKAFKIMISFENVSSCIAVMWITPVLVWGQHTQPRRIKPWIKGPCAGGRGRGGTPVPE